MEPMHQQQQQLPPFSPPRSRPSRTKKQHDRDPFLAIDDTSNIHVTSPAHTHDDPHEESLLVRIILTPILFTSFLLSLFLINRSDRIRRTHRSDTTTAKFSSSSWPLLTSYLSPSSWFDLSPEPYQEDLPDSSIDTREQRRDSHHTDFPISYDGAVSDREAKEVEEDGEREKRKRGKGNARPWHLRKKVRKVTKLEMEDAFAMRRRVIAGMLIVWVVALYACWRAIMWLATML
ncbi:unnamed protein product [Periconia digitata]|uniref:Uncharacterized protein n=1 Tax=Periconia digitata TaxID=1303443 RepID=A0A9W4UT23_9PLEO|nr:unnamed protein product [Periconia digitata]